MRSAVVAVLLLAGSAVGQVKAPPPPDTYQVDLRYRIRTSPDDRIRQYRAMTEYLRSIGFEADPREDADLDPFDPTAELLSGTLPAKARDELFKDARIRTALFRPAGSEYPDGPAQVRIGLAAGLEPADQRLFHDQSAAQLSRLGLTESVGYDHRNYTLIRGAMPGGTVARLLTDLRDLPAGWFLSDIPREQLNAPFRNLLPIRWVEVLPSPAPPSPEAGPTDEPPAQPGDPTSPKLQPDVLARLGQGGPQRLELVLAEPLPDGAGDFRGLLRLRAAGVSLEGVVGAFATVRVPGANELTALSQLPQVLSVRTPRAAVDAAAGAAVGPTTVLRDTRLADLHAAGYTGFVTSVVVIGTGFEPMPNATLIDLTAELNPSIDPAAASGTAGTAVAKAVAAAAPKAAVVLVRVDPAALFQLAAVARAAIGDSVPSAAIQTRGDEQANEATELARKREAVTEEYQQAFSDLSDDDRATARRKAAREAFDKLTAEEAALRVRVVKLAALREQLASLRGANVIVNTLVWEDGYALDGLSEVSRLLDDRFVRPEIRTRSALAKYQRTSVPAWVQAAGPSAANVWAGPLLDADDNGAIEFVRPDAPRVVGTWSHELNFLAAADGKADLPAGARLRFVLQWREPQDPNLPYSDTPAVTFTLRLLKQTDPTGTTASTDDLTEAARSTAPPLRLSRAANAGIFEQVLDVTVPAAGRYAMRIEARPATQPLLGALRRDLEITPRLTVRSLDGGVQPVFATYTPSAVGVGVPGDATAAFTVAGDGGPTGAGPGVLLRVKPDVRLPGLTNNGLAAGYAGGLVACLAQAGLKPQDLTRSLGVAPGARLELPGVWLRTLQPAR